MAFFLVVELDKMSITVLKYHQIKYNEIREKKTNCCSQYTVKGRKMALNKQHHRTTWCFHLECGIRMNHISIYKNIHKNLSNIKWLKNSCYLKYYFKVCWKMFGKKLLRCSILIFCVCKNTAYENFCDNWEVFYKFQFKSFMVMFKKIRRSIV